MRFKKEMKLIVCILPKGMGTQTLRILKDERRIVTANVTYARGVGRITPLAYRGIGEQTEKEILTVVVDASEADELFEYLHDKTQVNRPHGGLIYQQNLIGGTPFTLPDLPEEQ